MVALPLKNVLKIAIDSRTVGFSPVLLLKTATSTARRFFHGNPGQPPTQTQELDFCSLSKREKTTKSLFSHKAITKVE